jgi:Glycosyl transferase family 2
MAIIGRRPMGTMAYMGGLMAVPEEFCWSWGQMIAFNDHYVCERGEFIHLDKARHSYHSWARNELVERMKGDWLFQVDTDHRFEPDTLARLLYQMNEHNLDVICGIYQFKAKPHSPVLYGWYPQKNGSEILAPLKAWKGSLIEIGAAGAGAMLVKRRVFDRIQDELGERPFDVIGQGGEDLAFFHRLRKLKIKAWCDTRVECHHLIAKAIERKDFDPEAMGAGSAKIHGPEVLV